MITQYIYDLLLDNDYVVVPGLGGFVCQYQSSILDRQRAQIQPPARTIAFNKALQQNDGLLVQHIVLNDQLNYRDAEDKVRQYVAQCNQQLHQIGSIQFPKIGRLYMDELKNIQFTPTFELLPFDDTFGFNPVHIQAITRTEEEKTALVEGISTPVTLIENPQKRWPYWTAASFAGLLLMGSVWMNLGQPTYQNVLTAGMFSGNIVNISSQQNEITINNQQIKSEFLTDLVLKNAEANLAKEPVALIEDTIVISEPIFKVVVGAFKGNKRATHFKEELEAKGYQIDLVTTPHNSFIKVVVNCTAADESTALGEIRNSIEKEAWLLN